MADKSGTIQDLGSRNTNKLSFVLSSFLTCRSTALLCRSSWHQHIGQFGRCYEAARMIIVCRLNNNGWYLVPAEEALSKALASGQSDNLPLLAHQAV